MLALASQHLSGHSSSLFLSRLRLGFSCLLSRLNLSTDITVLLLAAGGRAFLDGTTNGVACSLESSSDSDCFPVKAVSTVPGCSVLAMSSLRQ